MKYKTLALFLLAMSFSTGACSQVYKCKKEGKTIFSDVPCEVGAKTIDASPAMGPVDPEAFAAAKQRNAKLQARQRAEEQAEEDRKNREVAKRQAADAEEAKRNAPEAIANRCFDTARPGLLDSRYAYVVSFDYRDRMKNKKIKVEGRARTRRGGVSTYWVYCYVDDNGASITQAYAGRYENLDSAEWR